eukprot:GHVS01030572.1.p1 GENE.GHVS01030572.1~~GHVS01030572.1.p1  ORF type:complete len:750 (+),score=142.08 GHVS01030572.1:152-2401(+)
MAASCSSAAPAPDPLPVDEDISSRPSAMFPPLTFAKPASYTIASSSLSSCYPSACDTSVPSGNTSTTVSTTSPETVSSLPDSPLRPPPPASPPIIIAPPTGCARLCPPASRVPILSVSAPSSPSASGHPPACPVRLFVTNFPQSFTEQKLCELFRSFGEVVQCSFLKPPVVRLKGGAGGTKLTSEHAMEGGCRIRGGTEEARDGMDSKWVRDKDDSHVWRDVSVGRRAMVKFCRLEDGQAALKALHNCPIREEREDREEPSGGNKPKKEENEKTGKELSSSCSSCPDDTTVYLQVRYAEGELQRLGLAPVVPSPPRSARTRHRMTSRTASACVSSSSDSRFPSVSSSRSHVRQGRFSTTPSQTTTSPAPLSSSSSLHSSLSSSHITQPSACRLFVGCLPRTTDEADLLNLFSRLGRVESAHIIRDEAQKSKCSGFVTYARPAMADNAIKCLNRQYVFADAKRPIEVRIAETAKIRVARSDSNVSVTSLNNGPAGGGSSGTTSIDGSNGGSELNSNDTTGGSLGSGGVAVPPELEGAVQILAEHLEGVGIAEGWREQWGTGRRRAEGGAGGRDVPSRMERDYANWRASRGGMPSYDNRVCTNEGYGDMDGSNMPQHHTPVPPSFHHHHPPPLPPNMQHSHALSQHRLQAAQGMCERGYHLPPQPHMHTANQHAYSSEAHNGFGAVNGFGNNSGKWLQVFCADGRGYYYNTVTRMTQWEQPQDTGEMGGMMDGGYGMMGEEGAYYGTHGDL